jgi:isopentenyldiphosphate isomerase
MLSHVQMADARVPHAGAGAELVDIVDRNDQPVATVPRAVMRRERLLHRAVYVAVFRPDGRLLIHRRSETKDIWPGWWDVAVGGVVAAGETWDDAARREVAEEIGVADAPLVPVGRGVYEDEELAVVGRAYRMSTAAPLVFVDGEIVDSEWIDTTDLPALVTQRSFLPDGLAMLGTLLGLG